MTYARFSVRAFKQQAGATILEYIIYTVLALGVFAGIAVFALGANANSNALGLAKDIAGTHTAIRSFYQGGNYGASGSLNATLIAAGNIIPADWSVAGAVITGQGSTGIVFTAANTTFTTTVTNMSRATCLQVLASSSGSQWTSVAVGVGAGAVGTAITGWPITQANAAVATACGAATSNLTAVFTSI